jgi:hypothetical protein
LSAVPVLQRQAGDVIFRRLVAAAGDVIDVGVSTQSMRVGQVLLRNLADKVIDYAEADRYRLGASIALVSP